MHYPFVFPPPSCFTAIRLVSECQIAESASQHRTIFGFVRKFYDFSPSARCPLWFGCHDHQHGELPIGMVFDSVGFACSGNSCHTFFQNSRGNSDFKCAFAILDDINLVRVFVCVNFLFLAGFKAVQVGKHMFRLEQIIFLHLLR